MANNYFAGFTHGGTQYSAQPTSAYAAPAAQTAYVQPAAQTAYAAAPRAQTYDAYQTSHSTAGQYAYTATRTQAAPTYDTSKTYYAPAAAAPAAAVTAVYTVAEPAYQAAKPTYTSTSYSAPTQPRQPTNTKPQTQPPASTSSYAYQSSTTTAPAARTSAGTRSGYDAAVYSAATNYYQHSGKPTGSSAGGASVTGSSASAGTGGAPWQKKTYQQKMGMQKKMPPKPPQLHYCEVCKISCAGPQTYREHLEGQKHKKKEIAAKSQQSAPQVVTRAALNQLRCELCDVACTGADAYAAHIRGAKHQKVLKLHTKLGKPIPSADPVVISTTGGATKTTASGTASATARAPAKTGTVAATATATPTIIKKVVVTPKITFVGGTQLKTTGLKSEEIKVKPDTVETVSTASVDDDKDDIINIPGEKDVQPVGLEYVEDIRNELGAINFYCKLCECKFNDPNAKLMHVKGRRHRLAYKKKVDPSLQVEMKPSIFGRKKQEEKLRRQAAKEEYWRRRDAEERWRMEWEQRRYEEELHQWQRMGGGRGQPFGQGGPMGMRRPDTSDDRHVMAKHASIYPNDQELQAVQNIVSSCEKSLKLSSDFLADSTGEPPKVGEPGEKKEAVKKEPVTPTATAAAAAAKKPEGDGKVKDDKKDGEAKDKEDANAASQAPRALKGVMRVGVLAKGLLLHGDLNVHLVVLCSEKPTRTLLERVADNLPKQLSGVCEDKYDVKICVEDAAVIVTHDKDPNTSCTITLTSPIMREENLPEGESVGTVTKADPPDVLDRQKCLDALAALRHAKWFQARANGLQSCVVVIRILRDLCQRVPTWTPLNQWQAMELLVEKCVSSGGTNMSPGDALRRVFEALASGILLPGGPGLYDPCEKDATDAASTLTSQEREDITASAQHALRLITFRQIHKVLGMDQLPQPKFARKGANPRKRRRTNSQGESPDGEGEGKKDKKDGDDGKMETVGDAAKQINV